MERLKINKGITLVALTITIIVLLILAGVSVTGIKGNNGILKRSEIAKLATELTGYNEELKQWKASKELKETNFQDDTVVAGKTKLSYNGKQLDGNIKTILPDLPDKYLDKVEIIKGELLLNTTDESEMEAAKIAKVNFNPYIIINGELMSSGKNLALMSDDGTVTVPETVTKIGEGAFSGVEGLKTIVIPSTVKEIAANAFSYNTTLENVIMQEGVTKIGDSAFKECTSLQKIDMPQSLNDIGEESFSHCSSLKYIKLPDNVKNIESVVFTDCTGLEKIELPKNLVGIGYSAFRGCESLKSLYLPASVNSIEPSAFSLTASLTDIQIDSNNKSYAVSNGIIYDINKTKIIFVSALNKNVTSLKIEDTVQDLSGTQLFFNCSNLQEVILPSSLKTFIGNVFEGRDYINKITISSSNQNFIVQDNMLLSKDGTKLYYATSGRSTLNIPDTVKEICMASIQGFKISEIRFGGNVEKIDEQFGKHLQGLTKIYIGTNVKDINSNFKDYTGIPNSLRFEIDSGNLIYKVLNNCILTKDGKSLLTYVNAKSEIVIPEGVETIYNLSWSNSITKVKLPNTLKKIYGIRGIDIESIDIPSSIETISETAFLGCSKLSNINIDKKQNSITGSPWGAPKGLRVVNWKR